MSMAEPFLPAHEPARDVAAEERDLDVDADVDVEAEAAGPEEHADASAGPFRPPVPGERLTAEQLAAELEGESGS